MMTNIRYGSWVTRRLVMILAGMSFLLLMLAVSTHGNWIPASLWEHNTRDDANVASMHHDTAKIPDLDDLEDMKAEPSLSPKRGLGREKHNDGDDDDDGSGRGGNMRDSESEWQIVMGKMERGSEEDDEREESDEEDGDANDHGHGHGPTANASNMYDTAATFQQAAKEKVGEYAESVRDKAGEWVGNAKDKLRDWQGSTEEIGANVREKGKEAVRKAQEEARQIGRSASSQRRQPPGTPSQPSAIKRPFQGEDKGMHRRYSVLLQEMENLLYPFRRLGDSLAGVLDLTPVAQQQGSKHLMASNWTSGIEWRTFENEYIALVDLPGIPQHEIAGRTTPDTVYIKAEHSTCFKKSNKEPTAMTGAHVKKDGRTTAGGGAGGHLCIDRKFVKRLSIPADVDPDKITAYFKDGVLIIQFPKRPIKAKSLPIKSYEPGIGEKLKEKLGIP